MRVHLAPASPGGPGGGSLGPATRDRLRRALLGLAADALSGPDGLAARLRAALDGRPLTTASLPLDIGAATETIPAHLRRAVTTRHPHCAFPGCDQPASVCDIHHLTPRARGGPTTLPNLVPLCTFHHLTAIHRWGWNLALHSDGTTTATSPDGTRTLHSPPSHGPPGHSPPGHDPPSHSPPGPRPAQPRPARAPSARPRSAHPRRVTGGEGLRTRTPTGRWLPAMPHRRSDGSRDARPRERRTHQRGFYPRARPRARPRGPGRRGQRPPGPDTGDDVRHA